MANTYLTSGNDSYLSTTNGEAVFGRNGDDTLAANIAAGAVTLDGGNGNDILSDIFTLQPHRLDMYGGAGNDTYVLFPTSGTIDMIHEDPGQGIDTVLVSSFGPISYTLGANLENLTYIGANDFTGTGNGLDNILVGANGNDTLFGLDGNDILNGGAGADSMVGGQGNDVYYVDSSGDVVVESAGQGTDTIFTTLNFFDLSTSGANVENLTYDGTSGTFTGIGNALANIITGGDGNDRLAGGDGNDKLYGLAGNDRLDGGAGNDKLYGDAGNDSLDGGAGGDTMYGGAGDDTYIVDSATDRVIEFRCEGTDTVYSSIDYVLPKNVENLILTGMASHGTGNCQSNSITAADGVNSVLSGLGGNDQLYGGTGNDTLKGGDCHDRLFGGHGDDRLIGGTGNDFLQGGDGADTFVFGKCFGKDTISDFNTSQDVLELSKAVFHNQAWVLHHSQDVGDNMVITVNCHDTITLCGVNKADLVASDFHFV